MKKTEITVPSVDETDLQILSILKDNARVSMKAIAERTFLSSTAVAARRRLSSSTVDAADKKRAQRRWAAAQASAASNQASVCGRVRAGSRQHPNGTSCSHSP